MNENPYHPSSSAIEHSRSSPHWAPVCFTVIAAIAYHGFIALLLSSSVTDQQGGMLMFLNTPVLVLWAGSTMFHSQASVAIGVVACLMQCVITAITVWRGIGDWQAVILIHGSILAVLVTIVVICWRYRPSKMLMGEAVSTTTH